MTRTITLLIAPDGNTKIETAGFTGQSCKDASKFIEQALGKTASEQFKPEYFVTIQSDIQAEARQ